MAATEEQVRIIHNLQVNREAVLYVLAIRNRPKKEYGRLYLQWLLSARSGQAPAPPAGLSYMAAQAVRLVLKEFYPAPTDES